MSIASSNHTGLPATECDDFDMEDLPSEQGEDNQEHINMDQASAYAITYPRAWSSAEPESEDELDDMESIDG